MRQTWLPVVVSATRGTATTPTRPSNALHIDRTEIRDIGVSVRDDERFPLRCSFQQLADVGFGVGDGKTRSS